MAVLGPVRVHGAAAPFRRSASLDLAVYLALHRRSVRHAEWALALWPDRPVSAATVYSTASDLRRALGRSAGGTARVSRGSALRLHHTVGSDVEHLAELARSQDPDDACRALSLVRGPLLSGLRRADWAVFDGTKAAIESQVVRSAVRAAELLACNGRPDEAEWAVRRGLMVSPYDERLYRALLRATAAQGSRVRLHATMAELRGMAAGCDDEASWAQRAPTASTRPERLHPRTTGLYRDLLLGAAAGGDPGSL